VEVCGCGRREEERDERREEACRRQLRCRLPEDALAGGLAAFCSSCCSSYWSCYSSHRCCKMQMQIGLRQLLETVLALGRGRDSLAGQSYWTSNSREYSDHISLLALGLILPSWAYFCCSNARLGRKRCYSRPVCPSINLSDNLIPRTRSIGGETTRRRGGGVLQHW
jgi:hypothetical protein